MDENARSRSPKSKSGEVKLNVTEFAALSMGPGNPLIDAMVQQNIVQRPGAPSRDKWKLLGAPISQDEMKRCKCEVSAEKKPNEKKDKKIDQEELPEHEEEMEEEEEMEGQDLEKQMDMFEQY